MAPSASKKSNKCLKKGSDYDKHPVPALRDEWKRRGLSGNSVLRKNELVAGLEADDAGRIPNATYEDISRADLREQCKRRGLSPKSTMRKDKLIMLLEDDDKEKRAVLPYVSMTKEQVQSLATERGISSVSTSTTKKSLIQKLRQLDKTQETPDSWQDTGQSQSPIQNGPPQSPNSHAVSEQNKQGIGLDSVITSRPKDHQNLGDLEEHKALTDRPDDGPLSDFELEMMELMAAQSDNMELQETQVPVPVPAPVNEPSWSTLDPFYLPGIFSNEPACQQRGFLHDLESFLADADIIRIADSSLYNAYSFSSVDYTKNMAYSCPFHLIVNNILGSDPFGNLLNPAVIWDVPHLHLAMVTLLCHDDDRFKFTWPRLYCGASWNNLLTTPFGSQAYDYNRLPGEGLCWHPVVAAITTQEATYHELAAKIKMFRDSPWGQQVWNRLELEVDARLLAADRTPSAFPDLVEKVAEHYLISVRWADSKVHDTQCEVWTVRLVQDLYQDGSISKSCKINIPKNYDWDRASHSFQEASISTLSRKTGYPHGYSWKDGNWNYQVDLARTEKAPIKMHKISATGFAQLRRWMLQAKSRTKIIIWHDVQIKLAQERRNQARKLMEAANFKTPKDWGLEPGFVTDDPKFGMENTNPWATFGITPGEPWPEDVRKAMYEYEQGPMDLSRPLKQENAQDPLANYNTNATSRFPYAKNDEVTEAGTQEASVGNSNSSVVHDRKGSDVNMEPVDDEAGTNAVFGCLVELETWRRY